MRRLLLAAVLVASVAVASMWWLTRDTRPVMDPTGDLDVGRNVLLVPGYGGGKEGLETLADALRSSGLGVEVIDIGNGQGSLLDYGEALSKRVVALAAETGKPVDVVGFSAGGVIARSAIAQSDTRHFGRIVTLGSPHGGTQLAAVGARFSPSDCPEACQQLAPDSELLASLPIAGDEQRWLSVYSDVDTVVRPVESGMLPGATIIEVNESCGVAEGVSHGDLPTNQSVASLVLSFLTSGEARCD